MRSAILALAAAGAVSAINPVPNINVPAYLGRWYQIAQDAADVFESKYCVTADYSILNNGTVGVLNRERQGGITTDYPEKDILGWASQDDPKNPAELTVHLQGVPVGAPYWIIAIGPETESRYEWAVVSDPFEISLFVLARNVTRFNSVWNETVFSILENEGFTNPLNRPVITTQEGCTYWQ